ncbi:hypothetical protein A2412_02905 [Candidatus Peribacteria bacterium RIFOXYC1_FULL_58_8]|nr:MAG: hypothetical protein A2412_02905 [Candidatus Peribacteria bacterium RIFOXYC1_FULL_58_8]
MASMTEGSPELATAQGFFENFDAKSPAEKKAILTNDQAFQKFMKELPADQHKFVNQLRQTMVETGNELSDDERKDIVDGAAKELEKFDATKASEVDKNIMLARMQMRGIDTSNPDGIFKKPPELKALEGSPAERGFSKIMGLIGFVLLNVQKMKEMINPGEKKGPAGSPEAGKPGAESASNASSAERRRNLVTEMTDGAKTGSELLTSKEDRLKALNDAAGPGSIAALQRIAESRRPSATAATATDLQKNELRDLDKRISDLAQERDKLQADVTELTAMKREVETGRAEILQKLNSIQDLLSLRAIPGTDGLAAALNKLTMGPNDHFQLTADPDAGANKWAHVNTINNVILTKLGRPPDQAISVDNLGVFHSPMVARDAMDALYKKLVEEARPAAAPAA